MRRALFLDRDGVINRELGRHATSLEEFELLPGVVQGVRNANDAGWSIVVITNQSGIGLGLYGHKEVQEMHSYLEHRLQEHGGHLLDIFYCPHHPSRGACLCRKPGSLLLERAIARHGLDRSTSVMIGDRERDIQAAESAGLRGILVEPDLDLASTLRTLDLC